MKKLFITLLTVGAVFQVSCADAKFVKTYTTTADESKIMVLDSVEMATNKVAENAGIITINPEVKYQEMDGFGAAITGSTCYNLLQMTPENRRALLEKTFNTKTGHGYSYIRVSIACSDFSMDEYTYCDKPGIENWEMHELDKRDLFPILKEIQEINPEIKIMASPWTPPRWMKVNNLKDLKPFDSWTSGQLNPKYYQDYATYFVKYVEYMKAEGFDIDAITIQNEPLNRGNSASLYMTWQEQRDFIKSALGPAFAKANIDTKIVVFDHNYNYDVDKAENHDQGQYPLRIYEDADAAKYIDGAAYHAYGGEKEELKQIHAGAPDKNLYFTEMSIGLWGSGYSFGEDLIWNMREVCIGTINNYNKAVIMWNFMLDDKHAPFRPGGCDICLGAVDIDSKDYATLTYNSHYYTMAHLSQVVKTGAYRIHSEGTTGENIHYSAFVNPDGSYSLVIMNDGDADKQVTVQIAGEEFALNVAALSVSSCIWNN